MTGFSTFDIEVSNSDAGLDVISDPNNPFTNFTVPSGVAINTIPSSPYFGTVYVGQASPSRPSAAAPWATASMPSPPI